ncbi:hypothetical protein OVY01_12265 [Robbsia sp. Bb-Pol-6]|uniref:Type II toxin-antitoxin system HicB family antitoxin n=1 Tax=Robbsia betulipollinis TaxID=2981849 RepID=A0ABT3ZNM5_9BURK|nr:hypothetical protein [Robbsia betulipollinis]MCY0387997.1 hypothetical protein [Robbsia betulipollinis]
MAGRITGPYKGFFINASASLNGASGSANAPHYVGALSLTEHGVDEPRKLERLVELGSVTDFPDAQSALEQLEGAARDYIDELLSPRERGG